MIEIPADGSGTFEAEYQVPDDGGAPVRIGDAFIVQDGVRYRALELFVRDGLQFWLCEAPDSGRGGALISAGIFED